MIRPATAAERDALEALQMRASLGNEADREVLMSHPDAVDIPLAQIAAGRVFVFETNGAIAGFYATLPREDGDTDLDALYVEPNIQRQGIGRLLVEHCATLARRCGSGALHVVGNAQAAEFYAASGFQNVGSFATRFGPALLLRRSL